LNHPHIITIYDIGQERGADFIAMEYVAGPSLAHVIGRLPPIPTTFTTKRRTIGSRTTGPGAGPPVR
jgi:serine/threonine-protein kinase